MRTFLSDEKKEKMQRRLRFRRCQHRETTKALYSGCCTGTSQNFWSCITQSPEKISELTGKSVEIIREAVSWPDYI